MASVQHCIANTNELSCQRMLRHGLPVRPKYDCATDGMHACMPDLDSICADVTCKVGDVFALAF